jgi:retinol dehydrogenase-12
MTSIFQTALITGGTNGIGKETARELSQKGINVTIVGQTKEKCIRVSTQLREETGNQVDWISEDLSSLEGVKNTALIFKEKYSKLDILINNAGAYFNKKIITIDGFEKTFALNHLNYFYLTYLLMDLLRDNPSARIINVSSMAHAGIRVFDFENLQGEKKYLGWEAYSKSKLCNLFFTYELSRLLEGTNITVNALHPGYVATGFANNNGPLYKVLTSLGAKLIARKPERGVETIIFLAISPEVKNISGKYFSNFIAVRSSHLSYDRSIAERLWKTSLELVSNQNHPGESI